MKLNKELKRKEYELVLVRDFVSSTETWPAYGIVETATEVLNSCAVVTQQQYYFLYWYRYCYPLKLLNVDWLPAHEHE
jgi:hypothetical protein